MTSIQIMTLPLVETFTSIQGEGHHQGITTSFIRLGGCNIGCPWCDTKESWDGAAHPSLSVEKIVDNVSQFDHDIVIITGGEPLMHDLGSLCAALHKAGYRTHLETSGAYPISGTWDWISLSPKKLAPPVPEIVGMADELKVVIRNRNDFQWAEEYENQVKEDCKLYLQPEWEKGEIAKSWIEVYIKEHPKWRMSLQLHKYLDLP